jgi:transcriptional regulator with XRE-family HTH domain
MGPKTLSKADSKKLNALGGALRGMRKARGLNQKDMGKLIGVRRETYGKSENGKREFTVLELLAIRNAFGEDPFERAALLRDKTAQAPRPETRRKRRRGTNAVMPNWPRPLGAYKRGLVTLRENFELERYSASGRRWNAVNSTVFSGAALAACIRLLTMQYDLPFATPPGAVDWALLISFGATLALLPSQLSFLAKFAIWCRGHATA